MSSLVGEAVRLREQIATARAALDSLEAMADDQLPLSQTAQTLGLATMAVIAHCARYDVHLKAPSAIQKPASAEDVCVQCGNTDAWHVKHRPRHIFRRAL